MRASLHLQHHIDLSMEFHFMDYVEGNAEHQLSQIVGLGLPMWLFVVAFVTLSSLTGDCLCQGNLH